MWEDNCMERDDGGIKRLPAFLKFQEKAFYGRIQASSWCRNLLSLKARYSDHGRRFNEENSRTAMANVLSSSVRT